MDCQQNNALQQFDEAWFDVGDQCGKDFVLPHVSTPLNPQWSDKGNLVFQEDEQPDLLERVGACNEVDSFPLVEMVRMITNSVSTVNPEEGSSLANHMIYFPEIKPFLFVPTPSINSSLMSQQLDVDSTNSQSLNSTQSSFLRNNQIHASSSGFASAPRILTTSNLAPIDPSSAYSSSLVPVGFPAVNNQEIRSSVISSSFLQNGSLVLTNVHGESANGDIDLGLESFQFVNHSTGTTPDVYLQMENDR